MTMKRDKIFQKIIRSNLSSLCENTDCHSSFLDIFVQKNLLSPYEKDVILGKGPKYERSSEFYFKIVQKGPSAYKAVVNALRKTDQNFAADILVHNGGILRDDILRTEENSRFSGSVVSDAMDLTGSYLEEAANSFNQLSVSSPLLLTPMQRLPTAPQTNISQHGIGVVPFSNNFPNPEHPFNLHEPNTDLEILEYLKPYSLQSSPKGYALIINIISFDHSKQMFREGASHDTEQLSKLFQDLGYLVYAIEDLTASQFALVLEEFKDNFRKNPVDSSIVSVMSHGDEGDNIYTRDRAVINIKRDILEKFTNVNCPQLKGKPKLFFFQFCRGDFTDYGTEVDSPLPSIQARTFTDSNTNHTTIPTWTDMLVCYSTLEGHYAYRETDAGSWFIQILSETLRKYQHQFDICELLNLVAQIMKTRVGEDGEKQICPYTNIGFTKKFYFNKTS